MIILAIVLEVILLLLMIVSMTVVISRMIIAGTLKITNYKKEQEQEQK